MRRAFAVLTLVLAAAIGVPAAASAHVPAAAPVELPAAPVAAAVVAAPTAGVAALACNPCYAAAKPKSGLDAVRFRTGPGTGYTALGSVQASQSILCWYPRALNPICNWNSTGFVT